MALRDGCIAMKRENVRNTEADDVQKERSRPFGSAPLMICIIRISCSPRGANGKETRREIESLSSKQY